jgi:hypothetical protein
MAKMTKTPKDHAQRMYRWQHNALHGSLGMAKSLTRNVLNSSSTTDYAKHLASEIDQLLDMLKEQLKYRIDPPKKEEAAP